MVNIDIFYKIGDRSRYKSSMTGGASNFSKYNIPIFPNQQKMDQSISTLTATKIPNNPNILERLSTRVTMAYRLSHPNAPLSIPNFQINIQNYDILGYL